jgi:hypothetical protein
MMFYIHHFRTKRSFIRGTIEYYLLGWLSSNAVYYLALYDFDSYADYAFLTYSANLLTMLAWYLFNDGAILTLIAALIMLVGIVGAIILTVKNTSSSFSSLRLRNRISDILIKQK